MLNILFRNNITKLKVIPLFNLNVDNLTHFILPEGLFSVCLITVQFNYFIMFLFRWGSINSLSCSIRHESVYTKPSCSTRYTR